MKRTLVRFCWKCREKTKHRIKFLNGDKESYFQCTCAICGKESMVQKGEILEAVNTNV
jgi:hypothetical protein